MDVQVRAWLGFLVEDESGGSIMDRASIDMTVLRKLVVSTITVPSVVQRPRRRRRDKKGEVDIVVVRWPEPEDPRFQVSVHVDSRGDIAEAQQLYRIKLTGWGDIRVSARFGFKISNSIAAGLISRQVGVQCI